MSLNGIVPVLVSPMNEDGSPDQDGYHKLLDHIYAHPVAGLWMLGSASEDFLMSLEHRVQITKIVSEYLAGKSHLIVGCGCPGLEETHQFFDETADMQIDAYHLLPNDRKMKPSMAYRTISQIAERAPKPVWLYNNEKRALKIPVEVVRDLKDNPKVHGIKAAGYDLQDIVPFCAMADDGFQVIGSGGGHLLVFLALGSTAHTASTASSYPGYYCQMFDLWQQGKHDEARQMAFRMGRMIKALPHPDNTEFAAEEKMVLELLGICKRHVHAPFVPCTEEDVEQGRHVLEEYGILSPATA